MEIKTMPNGMKKYFSSIHEGNQEERKLNKKETSYMAFSLILGL